MESAECLEGEETAGLEATDYVEGQSSWRVEEYWTNERAVAVCRGGRRSEERRVGKEC